MNSPQIIIWNLVSGHIFCRLKAPKPEGVKTFDPLEGDAAVGNLVFLPMRGTTRRAATLIACGPAGFIHFWNIYKGGKVMSHFIPVSLSLLRVFHYVWISMSSEEKGHIWIILLIVP